MKLQRNVHIETYIVIYLNVEIKSFAGGASISIHLKRYCHGMNTFCAEQWANVCLSNFSIDLHIVLAYVIVICNCQFQGPIFVSPILPDSSKPNVFLHQHPKKIFGCLYRFIKLILFVLIVLYHCVLILCTLGSKILHIIYFRRYGPALKFERRVLSSVGTSRNQRKGLSRKTSTCRDWQMSMLTSSERTTWNASLLQSVLISHFCFV